MFVSHTAEVVVHADLDGDEKQDWSDAIKALHDQVVGLVHDNRMKSLATTKFSTSTPDDIVTHGLVFMDAVKAYVYYEMDTLCGIPEIKVTGTKQDWETLKGKVDYILKELELEWWNEQLQLILEQFVNVFEGRLDASRKEQGRRDSRQRLPVGLPSCCRKPHHPVYSMVKRKESV